MIFECLWNKDYILIHTIHKKFRFQSTNRKNKNTILISLYYQIQRITLILMTNVWIMYFTCVRNFTRLKEVFKNSTKLRIFLRKYNRASIIQSTSDDAVFSILYDISLYTRTYCRIHQMKS